jgi:hypothetical protein
MKARSSISTLVSLTSNPKMHYISRCSLQGLRISHVNKFSKLILEGDYLLTTHILNHLQQEYPPRNILNNWCIDLLLNLIQRNITSIAGLVPSHVRRDVMQEHHLQSQQCMHGGKQMTSQQYRVSKKAFNSEFNQLLRYFCKQHFKM